MQSHTDPRSRRTILLLEAGFVVLLVLVAGWFLFGREGEGEGDTGDGVEASTEMDGEGSTGSGSTTSEPPSTSTTVADETGALADRSAWAGRYRWDEFVEGDPGSDQTLIHDLMLEAPADPSRGPLTGRLVQNGFQTATELTIVARPIDDGVAIEVVSIDAGRTALGPGDVAVRLTGDPAAPLTTIDALVPLVVDLPTSGLYFLPDGAIQTESADGGDGDHGEDETIPGTFWAIEAERFDLIEIDAATGTEVRRIAGWGGDPAEADEGFFQALQRVDVAADGWLWVDDCCEPAAGNIFGLDPDRITSLAEVLDAPPARSASQRLIGLNPIASPDGALVAFANHSLGVAVVDRDGREVASVPGADPDTFPTPVAWLDGVTLAVAEAGVDGTTITFWDLAEPARPVAIGSSATVPGNPVDGAAWPGAVLLVLSSEPFTNPGRRGFLIDLEAVEAVDVVDVVAGLRSVDRDAGGRHLLTVGADGLARLGQPDGSGDILSDIEVIWASW